MTALINGFRKNPDGRYNCGQDCEMFYYENASLTELDKWVEKLVAYGYDVLQSRELYGNTYVQLKKDMLVTAYFTPCDNTLRITESSRTEVPCFEPGEVVGENGTTFYCFENDHSLIDCGMCLLIQCPDYSFFIVDSGHYLQYNDNDRIYSFMRERTPDGQKVVVNGWFLTHAHTDHVSKFMDYLRYNCYDTVIEGIYSNLLPADYDENRFGNEECEVSAKLFRQLDLSDIPHYKLHAGQRIFIRNLSLDVLGTHEDVFPKRITNYNDSSAVIILEAEDTRIFIPGDASDLASEYLEPRYGDGLKCDIIQVSHHGHHGLKKSTYDFLRGEIAVFPITRIKFDEELPRVEANPRIIELAGEYYISSDGTVQIDLPLKEGSVKTLPDESFEDFPKIKRLWHYDYTDERKEELYSIFLEHGGNLDKFVFPSSPKGNFEM